ncbi:MAG: alpha/beta hydrolase [Beijerinckiaceae bacterium]
MRRFAFWPCGLFPARIRASSPQRLLAVAVTVFGLAGCAAPSGFLKPVGASASPGTSQVEMLVATTRAPANEPAEMFSGERGSGLEFADVVVSIPPVHQKGKVEFPHQVPGDPATDFVTLDPTGTIDKTEATALFRKLLRKSPNRQVLVFVHGYNNRFEEAVFRFAQWVHDSKSEAVPVLFTWPSKGKLLSYGYDRESVEYSRDELEQGLRFLVKDPEVREISIFAHSMGNWVTLEALRQMAIKDGRVAGKIRNVVLASADVGVKAGYKQIDRIEALGAERPNFTLVTREDDRALPFSRKFWGEQRLGAIDLDEERTNLERRGIVPINATTFHSRDPSRHFPDNPELMKIIDQALDPDQTLTREASFAERLTHTTAGFAASAGQAASAVISAPLAIVDPGTRENYGDQIDTLTQSVQDAVTLQ